MIGRLVGIPVSEELSGNLVLDVGGVGYELICPVGTLARAPRDDQGRVTLVVHTHLRQDALDLFGFASAEERLSFRLLVQVPGVGPKTAVSILSALPIKELAPVIDAQDLGRLGKIPGIGKKTAERLALELRGKLTHLDQKPDRKAPKTNEPQDVSDKLVQALVGLGYRAAEADKAIKSLPPELDAADLGTRLRAALRALSG